MTKKLVEVKIKRRDYEKTHSARFYGNLQFISNEYGVIRDWKIILTNVWLDLYTTERWFKEPNAIFKSREKLFKELGFKQIQRPNIKSNSLIELDKEQIIVVNNFLNDRNKYNSTLKNIVGIIKGNNPGGEAKNPKSAEMILDLEDSVKNFVILFDDLTYKYKNYFEQYIIGAEKISFYDFVSLNSSLKAAFNFMQKSKNQDSFSMYLQNIKDYYKKFNNWSIRGNMIASTARSQYAKNILNTYKNTTLPFGFNDKKQYQNCHIYEYWILRDKIIEAVQEENEKDIEKYKNMISDAENFLPLPEEVHRQFDRHIFTYKLNGEIYAITKEGLEYINNVLNTKYKNINKNFLTKRRKFYLEKRNEKNILINFWVKKY